MKRTNIILNSCSKSLNVCKIFVVHPGLPKFLTRQFHIQNFMSKISWIEVIFFPLYNCNWFLEIVHNLALFCCGMHTTTVYVLMSWALQHTEGTIQHIVLVIISKDIIFKVCCNFVITIAVFLCVCAKKFWNVEPIYMHSTCQWTYQSCYKPNEDTIIQLIYVFQFIQCYICRE